MNIYRILPHIGQSELEATVTDDHGSEYHKTGIWTFG